MGSRPAYDHTDCKVAIALPPKCHHGRIETDTQGCADCLRERVLDGRRTVVFQYPPTVERRV